MTDRVTLVVGASSGIGLATAEQLAAQGEHLVLAARSIESLADAARACEAAGARSVVTVAGDVNDDEDVRLMVARALDGHGRLDAVVHTATVMAYGTIEALPAEVFERVVDTAVHGTARLARHVLPVFRRQGAGTLVVVNSLLGSVTVPSMGAYCTAKWGQQALVRTLQQELVGERGIHVCLVSPGSTNTPIYYQAASWSGRRARPPWPVVQPETTGRVIARLLDRPRGHVSVPVGPTNPVIVAGYRLLPAVYDRIVRPLFSVAAQTRVRIGPTEGNVFSPRPAEDRRRGHWPPPDGSPPGEVSPASQQLHSARP
ncbi:MAG: SDR family NAD(P)-dependent oxidoreductase [Jatrophihabitans sp.]|uniref:SDR family NAD(P)-dependent oxidoreductase n=1 Tax=Jatrophihabitans sp. TaxID=1932789 RepID=UPI003F81A527